MLNEIAQKLKRNFENYNFESDKVNFSNKSYKPLAFSKKNYIPLGNLKRSEKVISFIDGGNVEIIKEAGKSLQFVRTSYNSYKNNKKINSKVYEFFILTSVNNSKFNSYFFTNSKEILPNEEDLCLSLDDHTIKNGIARGTVSRIGGIARLFAEYNTAVLASKKSDYVVIDGTLQSQVTNHEKYIKKLIEFSEKYNSKIFGISKSSEIITSSGRSLNSVLMNNSNFDRWIYHPVFERINSNISISYVKLHKKSKRAFRLENIGNIQKDFLSLLIDNSQDPIFFGYPYGLVDADKFARVSKSERDYFRTIISTKSKIEFEQNSHEILDNISF